MVFMSSFLRVEVIKSSLGAQERDAALALFEHLQLFQLSTDRPRECDEHPRDERAQHA
jgi:hypothetical protein